MTGTTVTVQVGPRNAYSDPETGLRYYRFGDRSLVSVTSARRMAGVPFALVSWQLSQLLTRACGRILKDEQGRETGTEPGQLEMLTAMLTRPAKPRERVVEKNRIREARTWLRAAATEERDAAAALGTAVHDCAAAGLGIGDVPDSLVIHKDGIDIEVSGADIRPRLAQYLDWLRVSEAEILLAERQTFNLGEGYAGSFDLINRMGGVTYLTDIKTGSGLYSEHLMQLVAYLMGEFVGQDDVRDEEATAILHSVEAVGILHIGPDSWEYVYPRADELAAAWDAFRGLLTFATWTAARQDPASWIETRRRGSATAEEGAAA